VQSNFRRPNIKDEEIPDAVYGNTQKAWEIAKLPQAVPAAVKPIDYIDHD